MLSKAYKSKNHWILVVEDDMLTKSMDHKNSNPTDMYNICSWESPNANHAESPPNTAANWRYLSIEPKVTSTGDKKEDVSIPFSFSSSMV